MKNTIVTLNDGAEYFIIEELNYNKKKYICAVPYERTKDELNDEEYYIQEISVEDGQLSFNDVKGDEATTISTMMLDKISKNN